MAMEIDRLELNLQGTSETGVKAIDNLISGLDRLQSALKSTSSPIGSASRQLDKLAASFERISKSSGIGSAMEAAATGLKGVSEQAQSMQGTTTQAFQKSSSEAKKAAEAEKQAVYQSRLDAKVAAQEKIQQAKAAAAEQIAAAKAAQQIQVAQAKERLAADKRVTSQQSQAAAIEEAMAEKRRVEQEQLDALVQKTMRDLQSQSQSSARSPYIADNDTTSAGSGKTATSTIREQQEAARAAEESGAQQMSVMERLRGWAERVGASFRHMTQAASSHAPDSEMGILNSKLSIANERISLQVSKLKELQMAYAAAYKESSSISSPVSRKAQEDILTARSRLASLRSEVNRLNEQMSSLKNGTDSASTSMRRFSLSSGTGLRGANNLSNAFSRMGRQLASQLFIYTLIWPAIQKMGQYMWSALNTSTAFSSALNNLKAQLLTAFYPIYQAALPALTSLVNALAKAMQYVAAFTAGLFGTTYSAAKSGASSLNKNIAAMEDQTAATKAANTQSKKWETYNKELTKQQKEYAAAVEKAEQRQEKLNEKLEETKKSLMGFDEINQLEKVNSDYETVEMPEEPTPPTEPSESDATMPSTTGNLSGVLGTDFSNKQLIPQSVIEAAEKAGETLKKIFDKISDILNFSKIKGNISSALSAITLLMSDAALAIGAILTFSGANVPLGLGLMAVGAVAIASTVAINWDGMSNKVKESVNRVVGVVSSAMLAVGAVLTFSGASPAIGIPMMLIGAGTLAMATSLNWNSTSQKVKSALAGVTLSVGAAALAVGTVLAFSGASLPVGISLMVVGASEIVAAVALNWDNMGARIKAIVSGITILIGAATLAVGSVLAFSGGNVPLGIALMAVGASGIVAAAVLNWDGLSVQAKSTISTISSVVGANSLALGAILAFSGVGLPVGIALMGIGAAALATSVAINWNTMKDNLRASLSSIINMLPEFVTAIGLLLCLSGVGIPVGIAMMAAGFAGMYGRADVNDSNIVGKVRSMGDQIKSVFNDIRNSASDMWNSLSDRTRSGLNTIIGKINGFLSGLEWPMAQVGKIPGMGWASSIGNARIPYLATGGIVTAPTLAMTGEQGTEAVIPLENNLEYLDSFAEKLIDKMDERGTTSGSNQPIQIIVKVGEAQLVNRIIKGINQKQLASGKIVLSV